MNESQYERADIKPHKINMPWEADISIKPEANALLIAIG